MQTARLIVKFAIRCYAVAWRIFRGKVESNQKENFYQELTAFITFTLPISQNVYCLIWAYQCSKTNAKVLLQRVWICEIQQ